MNTHVFTGKTIEDAIAKGLAELDVARDRVDVSVMEQPSRGILGFIGAKDAKVQLTVKEEVIDPLLEVHRYLSSILVDMGIKAEIEMKSDDGDHLVFNVVGEELGMFIGRRGQTLDAIQLLLNVFINRISDRHIRIQLDAEKFRERRKKTLENLSLRLANQVVRTRKEVMLEPMTAQERRIIHTHLQKHPKVKTFSKGEEPSRRIVIALK